MTKKYLRNKETKGLRKDAGFYSIPCNSCNLQYIGESDNFARRLQQHSPICELAMKIMPLLNIEIILTMQFQ